MRWSGTKSFSFDRLEVEHLCEVIRLAQRNGHGDCGFCDSLLLKFERSLAANGVGIKKSRIKVVG